MAPPIKRFQFDPTGQNRNNWVPGEVCKLDTKQRRIIVPMYGAFYGASVQLIDAYTLMPLKREKHFVLESMRQVVTDRTGLGVYGIIVVTDPSISDTLLLSYQAVGGAYMSHADDVLEMSQRIAHDDRSVLYGNIDNLPDDFLASKHFHDLGDFYNFDGTAHDFERLRMLHDLTVRIDADSVYVYIENEMARLSKNGSETMVGLLAAHKVAPEAHTQYVKKTEVAKYIAPMRTPANVSPTAGQREVPLDVQLKASKYYSLYRQAQASARYQISKTAQFDGLPVVDVTVKGLSEVWKYQDVLESSSIYYWRVCYADEFGNVTPWSTPTSFTTMAVSVTQPQLVSPTNGVETDTEEPTLTSSLFQVVGDVDNHASTDWELWTGPNGTGTLVWASVANTTNKTSIKLPMGVLTRLQTYYPRVRHRAAKYGPSAWSSGASFYATWPLRPTVIGQLFRGGFWGGDITYGGNTYAIIVAPKALGEQSLQLVGNLVATPGAVDSIDSVISTNGLAALVGTNASKAAAFVRGLNIAGYTDWVIPSLEALIIVQRNLAPNGANTPVSFKGSGVEAFASGFYWTSTTSDYTSQASYTTGGEPIYQSYLHQYTREGSIWSGPTGETVDVSPSIKCNAGETGPRNVRGPTFHWTNGSYVNNTRVGYWEAYWNCDVQEYRSTLVGYEPVEYHYYTVYHWHAHAVNMATAARVLYDKNGTRPVRAVRLVRVA